MTNTNAHLNFVPPNETSRLLEAAFDFAACWYRTIGRETTVEFPESHPDNVTMIHLAFIWYSMLCELDELDLQSELVQMVEYEGSLIDALLVAMFG